MDLELLKLLAQIGIDGILLFLLAQLWTAFQEQNKFIREELVEAKAEREVLLRALGLEGVAAELKRNRRSERFEVVYGADE